MLSEQRRTQLDGIVHQMVTNKEKPDSISFVVDDFKSKYGNEVQEQQQPQKEPIKAFSSPAISGLAGSLGTNYVGNEIAGAGQRIQDVIGSAKNKQTDIATQSAKGEISKTSAFLQTAGNVASATIGTIFSLPVLHSAMVVQGGITEGGTAIAKGLADSVYNLLPESTKAKYKLAEQDKNPLAYKVASDNTQAILDVVNLGATAVGGAESLNKIKAKIPELVSKINENVSKLDNYVIDKKVGGAIQDRVTELTKLEDSYKSLRNTVSKAESRGVNVKEIIANTDLLKNAVDNTGTIRTTQEGGAVKQLQEFIRPQENIISKILEKEGNTVPLDYVRSQLETSLANSKLKGASLENAYGKIETTMKGLARRADPQRNIQVAKIQDAKINAYDTLDYMNEGSKMADKAIARTFKDIVNKNTSSADVNALNAELSKHYSVLDFLETLDGKKVEGGRLGKYFAKTVGAVVGSHFGPLGSIVGAEIAGGLKGVSMSGKFSGDIGSPLQQSATMKGAINQANSPRLQLSAPKEGAPRKQVGSGKTIKIAPKGSKIEITSKNAGN